MKELLKMIAIASALVSLLFLYFISPYGYLLVCSFGVLFILSFCFEALYPNKIKELKVRKNKIMSRVGELSHFVFNVNAEKV